MEVKDIFTDIYNRNGWKCEESKSGPGSRVSVNKKLLSLLEDFVKQNNVKTIVDCGCGDFNWMKLFNFDLVDKYIGIDIVEPLINKNKRKYSNNKIDFKCQSIIDTDIPECDLIICKDVLFHLSFEDSELVIKNIKKVNPKFLMSTTFTDFENLNIKTGNWRPINLLSHPFNFNTPFIYWDNIEDRKDSLSNKSIGIWKHE